MQVTFVSHICIEILQHVKPLRVSHKRGLCILVASTVFLGDLLFVYFPPPHHHPPPPIPPDCTIGWGDFLDQEGKVVGGLNIFGGIENLQRTDHFS